VSTTESLIEDCKKRSRSAQEKMYQLYYGYAMSVSLPYSSTEEEAQEVVNDAFIKVFLNLSKYDTKQPFKGWFRRILINTAIDSLRSNKKYNYHLDVANETIEDRFDENIIEKMSAEEILKLVQALPPAYKMVFNLYAIEGYKHHEIAGKLQITEGTSKSNLAKARNKLRNALQSLNQNVN
jgi:RNA polymerase sigma-70 factor (ECF subfamily)